MSEVLTKNKKRVAILQSIDIDRNLPKYKGDKELKADIQKIENDPDALFSTPNRFSFNTTVNEDVYTMLSQYLSSKDFDIDTFNVLVNKVTGRAATLTNNFIFGATNTMSEADSGETRARKGKQTLFDRISSLFNRKKREVETEKFDVLQFFSDVKKMSNDGTQTYVDRVNRYLECLGYAEKNGQVALKEKLLQRLIVNKYESVLYANGMYKAISEENIVKLALKSDKALSLDYIRNYAKMIPIDAMRTKTYVDTLRVFDNYCVLYYDPDGTSYLETKEEYERRKDPILFGMIEGSDKLYYICDWVDEYCDLTLDKVVDILGKEVLEQDYLKKEIAI